MDKESVLSALDGLQNYEKEYEERKRKHAEEESTAAISNVKDEGNKHKSIHEEIAETLRKIKEKEDENAKKFEVERRQKEEKRRKELEIKEKIQKELQKIKELEEIQNAQIRREQEEKEKERLRVVEEERNKMQLMDAESLKSLAVQRKRQAEERKQLMEEVEEMKFKKAQEEARRLIKESKESMAERIRHDLGMLRVSPIVCLGVFLLLKTTHRKHDFLNPAHPCPGLKRSKKLCGPNTHTLKNHAIVAQKIQCTNTAVLAVLRGFLNSIFCREKNAIYSLAMFFVFKD